MARPGEQTWLFGRVRIDRPTERVMEAVSDASAKRGQRRAADDLDKAASGITDPRKRRQAEAAARRFRRKHC